MTTEAKSKAPRKRRRSAKQQAPEVLGVVKRKDALEMRAAGFTFSRIGAELGISKARAHQLVTEELDRLNEEKGENAERLRALEIRRLDRYLEALEWRIEWGDVKAIEAANKLSMRRARLQGLDAPKLVATVRPEDITPAGARASFLARFGALPEPKGMNGANGHGGNGAAHGNGAAGQNGSTGVASGS